MKRLILLVAITLISVITAVGQNSHTKVERQGNQFIETKVSQTGTLTPYTYIDKDEIEYQIYVMDNGRCYINKVSKKSGKTYKKYLDEDTCKTICKELNVPYTYVKKQK